MKACKVSVGNKSRARVKSMSQKRKPSKKTHRVEEASMMTMIVTNSNCMP